VVIGVPRWKEDARPKSISFSSESIDEFCNKKFSGLMSRCATQFACK